MFKVILFILTISILVGSFMEGYNKLDTPKQVRKISKAQQQQTKDTRLEELEREKEVLQLKKEIEELKSK